MYILNLVKKAKANNSLLSVILWFLFSFSTSLYAQQTIIVLGDSISAAYGVPTEQGWVSLLQSRLKINHKQYTVVNASISGDTTNEGLKRLPSLLERHQASFILIELGGNDGLRGYPLNSIKKNLEALIKQSKERNITPILLAMRIPPNYGKRYTSGFQKIYQDIAKESDITLVPFLMNDVATNPELMQKDGIHPTTLAQTVLLDAVWNTLKPLL
jgi:acyl-CoA thioesterase I